MTNIGHFGLQNPGSSTAVSGTFALSGSIAPMVESYYAAETISGGFSSGSAAIPVAHRQTGQASGYVVRANSAQSGRWPAFGFINQAPLSGDPVPVFYAGEMIGNTTNTTGLPAPPGTELYLGSGIATGSPPDLSVLSGSVSQFLGFYYAASGGVRILQIAPDGAASGTIFAQDLASGVIASATSGAFVQSGNSFGMTGNLGTVDAFNLDIKAGGTRAMIIQYTDKKIMLGNPASGNPAFGLEMRRPDDGAQQMNAVAIYNSNNGTGASENIVIGNNNSSGGTQTAFELQVTSTDNSTVSGSASFVMLAPQGAGLTTILQHDGHSGQFYINEQCKMQVDTRFRPSSGNIAEAGYDQIFSRYVMSGDGGGDPNNNLPSEANLFHMTDRGTITQLTPRNQCVLQRDGQTSGNVTSGAITWPTSVSGVLTFPTLLDDPNNMFALGSVSGTLVTIQNSGFYSINVQNKFKSDTFNTATTVLAAVIGGPNSGLVLNKATNRVVSGMINQTQDQTMHVAALLQKGDIIEIGVNATGGNTASSGCIASFFKFGP